MTRLTEEMVIARSKQSDLSSIKKLNCWGSDLSDVSIIKRLRGVEVLALSVNKITTLQPFEDCSKLQELYLRKNNIQDINEIAYLQNLPALKYLWLEENPCCDRAGPNYRSIVLHALPNLKKLDNVDVTQEEIDEAIRLADSGRASRSRAEEKSDDAYEQPSHEQQQQHQQLQQHSAPQQIYQQYRQQQQQPSAPPQQYAARSSPSKEYQNNNEQKVQVSNAATCTEHTDKQSTENASESSNNQASTPSSPSKELQASSPTPKYITSDPKENRYSSTQIDHSPGSDQESSPHSGYHERAAPIPPSMSTHSMKEYYQSDRPAYAGHYRHSQTDLTEWEEHQQHNQYASNTTLYHGPRRSAGAEREMPDRYAYRNGHARENGGDWEEPERPKPTRRLDGGRYHDSASVVSTAVLNHHYSGYHRRPINRSSNLLSATLCLVKELDYSSLEVVEHAVRCRIDELSSE